MWHIATHCVYLSKYGCCIWHCVCIRIRVMVRVRVSIPWFSDKGKKKKMKNRERMNLNNSLLWSIDFCLYTETELEPQLKKKVIIEMHWEQNIRYESDLGPLVFIRTSDMGHIWTKKSDLGHFDPQNEFSLRFVSHKHFVTPVWSALDAESLVCPSSFYFLLLVPGAAASLRRSLACDTTHERSLYLFLPRL